MGRAGLDVLILDPNNECRNRLKQAVLSTNNTFSKVHSFASIMDLQRHTEREQLSFDAIFISDRFPADDLQEILRKGKEGDWGKLSAYILLVKPSNQERDAVGRNLVGGFDSFLLDPYSVEAANEVIKLASEVKNGRQSEREKLALKMLARDLIGTIDKIAWNLLIEKESAIERKKFRALGEQLRSINPERIEDFLANMSDEFCACPPPRDNLSGVRSRVRERMRAKLRRENSEETAPPAENAAPEAAGQQQNQLPQTASYFTVRKR